MTRPQTATWNREDRDLLVELRTTMFGMNGEISALRGEVKEINTGITARLLNLEANAVSKIEINPRLDAQDRDIADLKSSRTEYRATIRAWLIMGGIVQFILTTGLAVYFHYH